MISESSDTSDFDEIDAPLVATASSVNTNASSTTHGYIMDNNSNATSNSIDLKVRNRALVSENRRLQELVEDFEKRLLLASGGSQTTATDGEGGGGGGDHSVSKLKAKIKSLKNKRKADKVEILSAKKSVDTHTTEIGTLQRELGKSLQQKDRLESDLKDAQRQLGRMDRQLQQRDQEIYDLRSDTKLSQLEEDLQKRDGELEVTLELLQSKVERIIQLEYEVQQTKDQLQYSNTNNGDNDHHLPTFNHASVELMKVDAECKSLRRQNMMLKLVVEELQEAHKNRSESDIDIDSVFMKLPKDLQLGNHHPDPALGAITTSSDFDDESEMTDFFNIGK